MVGLFGWGPPHAGHGNVGQVIARIVMVVVAALGLLIAAAVFAAGNAAQDPGHRPQHPASPGGGRSADRDVARVPRNLRADQRARRRALLRCRSLGLASTLEP